MSEQVNSPLAGRAPRVLLVGNQTSWSLEGSYVRGFESLGCKVATFDIGAAVAQNTRLGRFGRTLSQFVPVEQWIRKANRLLVLEAMRNSPDILLLIGNCPVQAGALAQVRAGGGVQVAHVWPDTLVNLEASGLHCLPLYDVVGAYSRAAVEQFERLGAPRVLWLPLGADPQLHPKSDASTGASPASQPDLVFVGGWRPEREEVLTTLSDFGLEIWGPLWGQRCKNNPAILRAWKGKALFGADYARATAGAKIALNIIDPTNFPAPNMRFFEIPVAGGLQLCSSCPEMEAELRDGEHLFYYRDPKELPDLVANLLGDEALRRRVSQAGHEAVMARHLYAHRAQTLIEALGFPSK